MAYVRWFLLAWLATTAVGALALTFLLYSAPGRRLVRDVANEHASTNLRGTIHIDELVSISGHRFRARGVQLTPPHGPPAIDAHFAEIDIDPWALLEGRFVWNSAHVRGGIVRVSEDERGRINMEELFSSSNPRPDTPPQKTELGDMLDFQKMATEGMTLEFGGKLPHLRMERLNGIMRIQADKNGRTELRFDGYRGVFVKGLPTGVLEFDHVLGSVTPSNARLLHFEGQGKSEGEPVTFSLDIQQEPASKVDIYARFPKLSAESLSTWAFGAYTHFTKSLRVHVSHGS